MGRNRSRLRNGRRLRQFSADGFLRRGFRRGRFRLEIRRNQQFVPFLRREPQHFGATEHVLAVAGPCGETLFPADQGGAAYPDTPGEVGIANTKSKEAMR